jgi:hypothetical protein
VHLEVNLQVQEEYQVNQKVDHHLQQLPVPQEGQLALHQVRHQVLLQAHHQVHQEAHQVLQQAHHQVHQHPDFIISLH